MADAEIRPPGPEDVRNLLHQEVQPDHGLFVAFRFRAFGVAVTDRTRASPSGAGLLPAFGLTFRPLGVRACGESGVKRLDITPQHSAKLKRALEKGSCGALSALRLQPGWCV
jgi:hypothetical protein